VKPAAAPQLLKHAKTERASEGGDVAGAPSAACPAALQAIPDSMSERIVHPVLGAQERLTKYLCRTYCAFRANAY
jgi:hypothetical protein